MDLKISGKTALVCASSKGLGRGCAEALAQAGCALIVNARTSGPLDEAADAIRTEHGVDVTAVAADIVDPEGRARVLDAAGDVDILVTNAGGPPPGYWTDWSRDDFIDALDAAMLTPIALMQALVPGMIERGWGRVVNITSRSVKAPLLPLGLSNSARAGLTGFVAGTSRQIAGKGVTINNLLPGVHDTAPIDGMDGAMAAQKGISRAEARKIRASTIPAGRYGDPGEFGKMCAFLCSQHAGYIVGQNIVVDGGETSTTI
ncbi:short-chain dehydrogenase [Salipiger aestuarii]|uniref:3-oxoacyl-[acyl-carrier protein] reductase n=1 Tax=Salipiger aestuarii TaxID=568098 RepID=A0A327XR57_9RHOB|nr:SDR family oxidoreductase [Salipiger aestuarii]EIE52529.1 short chain dehydrogenase/reductase family oxidoreductase [Citreicella sp. 357]KAA8605426.1 short-chain dehydrogenase [Salipiger aestuarii]KAA8608070.1 short-chain dehydrogenase [Salipiger aestuarii]KAB2539208.1 short-chain dehydrogenase [Salipiger aestuarii]RAK10426.1 3-oxoacyl-[acyl-carrier protein] reductase [Salipiger aestuarii]